MREFNTVGLHYWFCSPCLGQDYLFLFMVVDGESLEMIRTLLMVNGIDII